MAKATNNLIGFEEELNKAIDNYNAKFGDGAYFKIEPLVDPLRPDGPTSLQAIKTLNNAVMSGKPLPNSKAPKDIFY
ncbi:hypothetical protein [Limosilactobacillus reuteri]|jgi:hypothetical protein|uniref:Uncharacterized protein n=1 Tax=Limosilactobacillus reuteri TaxID=1598 RepID=A0A7L6BFQ8_LIMRT|nr:hypothetical protein [Limosilactobacillus reuteri]MCC4325575.1 hypothetical protein [Limosilactobacillus reuteri]MCC4329521.1 hypothetical protein [Limosilactobacillus reuteri]MCC4358032.1 hypothetical protein [Limosilactobacillus reuteri]MCC4362047.1 hypothetical protein [Limosilactobacillus reuteri]MCC4363971.1 hypothetical protein [Limosilactobacillus reuteri]